MVMMMFVFRTAAGFLIFTMIMFFMIVMVVMMIMLMMFIFVMVLMCMTFGHNHRIRLFFRRQSTDFFYTLSFIMIALILE